MRKKITLAVRKQAMGSYKSIRNKYTSTLLLKTTPLAIHWLAEVWEDDGDDDIDDEVVHPE